MDDVTSSFLISGLPIFGAALTFVSPWVLAGLAGLPLLWWLLRVVPPPPRRQSFPAIRLLMGLEATGKVTAQTPFWLILLRLGTAATLIAAAAHPLLNAAGSQFTGPMLLVVDDSWAAAKQWPQRQSMIDALLTQAERQDRPVVLLPTAPTTNGEALAPVGFLSPTNARNTAQDLTPHPWPADHAAARRALDGLPHGQPMQVVWISDGLHDPQEAALLATLQTYGRVEIVAPPPSDIAKLLMPPRRDAIDLTPKVRRASAANAETITLRALDAAGHTLARENLTLTPGQAEAELRFALPSELRNRVARLQIDGEGGAGAVVLLDGQSQHRPVGLIDDQSNNQTSPLLDDLYYLDRALAPFAELRRGSIETLLTQPPSLMVLPDRGALSPDEQSALSHWIEGGGVLLRLAGPHLAGNPGNLLPVPLRGGGRVMGGAMSWTHPMAVAPMPETGPFAGLTIPADLRIKAQVLAEPSLELNDHAWARLEDGTPLVTGQRLGNGWLVLIHTTVWPTWSNLGLTGLLPDMLQRLLTLGQGVSGQTANRPLPPSELLDGFGHLAQPDSTVQPLSALTTILPVGPQHPPGLYGDDSQTIAFNLAPAIANLPPIRRANGLSVLNDLPITDLGGQARERDLRPSLLMASLGGLLLDLMAVLGLRGALNRLPKHKKNLDTKAVPLFLLLLSVGMILAMPHSSQARPAPKGNLTDDEVSISASLAPRLAYVITGDSATDETSRAGLIGLTRVLAQRTTADLAEPLGVTVERDTLSAFPLLYWPVTNHQATLSAIARSRINDFLHHGGMILFDTQDRGDGGPDRLRSLTEGLDIPPLAVVTEDHVLTRSYYLLRELSGRYQGAPTYAQQGGDPANDGVSPVVIGGNDWAAAWAIDKHGQPLFAAMPGGEQQREMAYRFGVNLVMYALTGNYKADQVHLPAILERLRR